MKKVLILCYDFPPLTSAGSFRPYSWFKYAKQNGFEPIVVSRHWQFPINTIEDRFKTISSEKKFEKEISAFGTHYKVNHKNSLKEKIMLKYGMNKMNFFRKTLTIFELLGRFNFSFLDDKHEMSLALKEIVQLEKPDLIIASGEPHILFTYCNKIKSEFNIPYVLDYRDGWFTNHTRNRNGFLNQLISKIDFKNEKLALQNALIFTSVVPQIVEEIQQAIFPQKGFVIPNGVDLSLYQNAVKSTTSSKFKLVHTGTVYDTHYDKIFENGLRKFLEKNSPADFEIHFYGLSLNPNRCTDSIQKIAQEFSTVIFLHDRLAQNEIVLIQQQATSLLSFIPGSHEKGIISMKTYEYLACKRPIIVIPSEPSKTTPIFPDKKYLTFTIDENELATEFESLYLRFKNGEDLSLSITNEELYSISREKSSQVLFEKINEVLTTTLD